MPEGPVTPQPGAIVLWWEGHEPRFGVVVGPEKQRIRLVVERGREERIKPARIAMTVESGGPIPGSSPEERREAAARLGETADRLRRRAGETDIPLLWSVVVEDVSEKPGPRTVADLAGLLLDGGDAEDQAALLLSLVDEGIHFYRRPEGWLPRLRSAVDLRIAERERVARQRRETDGLFELLESTVAGRPFEPSNTETETRYLQALEDLAVHDEEATGTSRDLALRALHASGQAFERPHEGAFRLLRRLGRFGSDDENLQVRRFGLRTAFNPQTLTRADVAASAGFDRSGRRDLSDLEAFSIDGPHTVEIDDLLSVEDAGGGALRLGIHIADPSAFVDPGDDLDLEASTRGLTYYLPGARIPMLPPAISEGAASLIPDRERPALSFLVEIDPAGEVIASEILPSIVRSRARLDYDAADATVARAEGAYADELALLSDWSVLRRQARVRSGAVTLLTDEVGVSVDATGLPRLERMPKDSPSRIVVMEAMILSGELAARIGRDAGIPLIYRRQAIATNTSLPQQPVSDPAMVRRVRRMLKRADVGLEPGAHESLGLAAYAQASSPIRRYQDLANQRQIRAAVLGHRPAHDREAMQRILATTERAEADARRAERAAREYWLLKFLEPQVGREIGAQVIGLEPRPTVLLDETLLEQPLPGLTGAEPGQRLRLRVERVNPRAGLLKLSVRK